MYRKSYEIIAYVGDGEILCDECGEELDTEDEDSPVSPIFLDSESDAIGATCGGCGACYIVDEGWASHAQAVDKEYTRWAICGACNYHMPYSKDGWSYRDARRSALYGKLVCRSCHGRMHF